MIYFIQSETLKFIKIGYCADGNLQRRYEALQVGSADNLIILRVIPNGTADNEREFHKKFKRLGARREWFHPEQELLEFIQELPIYKINELGLHFLTKISYSPTFFEKAEVAYNGD